MDNNPNSEMLKATLVVIGILIILSFVITIVKKAKSDTYIQYNMYAIDGDSIRVTDRLDRKITYNVRVMGMNTPEIRHAKCEEELQAGIKAKQILNNILSNKKNTIIIHWEMHKKDKYGRMLGHVYVNNRNLADIAISDGWARPYEGGKRRSWCNE